MQNKVLKFLNYFAIHGYLSKKLPCKILKLKQMPKKLTTSNLNKI